MNISRAGTAPVQITWATNFADYVLDYASALSPGGWSTVTIAPATIGNRLSVTVEANASQRFFRLRKP